MRFLHSYWCPLCLGIITLVSMMTSLLTSGPANKPTAFAPEPYREGEEWVAPSLDQLPAGEEGDRIRYGHELITNTAKYLGPHGLIATLSNGMNCQNCHIAAGTQNFGNPFSGVANNYPRYRDRSGRIESTEFRINECMQRSMNGKPLDSTSEEMKAMVAYVKWVGKDVPKDLKPAGTGAGKLHPLDRPADPVKGRVVFMNYCQRCHGENGEGFPTPDGVAYNYPPLWGEHSFNVSAGMYRLSGLAGFIKNNMPFGVTWKTPQLSDEQAWDVAAFVASQPRPQKFFAYDWKDISKKPVDYPFGPYADGLSEQQHKYGPWGNSPRPVVGRQ